MQTRAASSRAKPSLIRLVFYFIGGIRTIPPGFTRGLDFGPLWDEGGGGLLEEEEEVQVQPIYRPMLEYNREGKMPAVPVSVRAAILAACDLHSDAVSPEWTAPNRST